MRKPTQTLTHYLSTFITKLAGDRKIKVILGLSGGPDSVALFHLLNATHQQGTLELICAHLNHGWRSDTDQDQEFCEQLCKQQSIKIHTRHASYYADRIKKRGSQEEYGRAMRRAFFSVLAKQLDADRIALAHHADDQQETFFIRLIRGTTLSGLCAMKEDDGTYIRPLLPFNKKTVLDYLHDNDLSFRTDQSNKDLSFLRNRIRHKVIPALRETDARFAQKFADTLAHLKATQEFLDQQTDLALMQVCDEHQRMNLKSLFNINNGFLVKQVVLRWLTLHSVSFTPSTPFLNEILRFLRSPRGGSHDLGPSFTIQKKQGVAWVNPETGRR